MDHIHDLDKKYAQAPVPCPHEGTEVKLQSGHVRSNHGNLGVHGSGAFLVCGLCGYNTPIGRIN